MKNPWARSKNECADSVADYLAYYMMLLERSKTPRYRVASLIRLKKDLFEKVDRTCKELGIPVSLFIDVLFQDPIETRRTIKGFQMFIHYLAANTAKEIFISRVVAYRKRMGALDDVYEYVRARSLTNLDNWFGNGFWEGYWLFHRLMDIHESFSLEDIFSKFEKGQEFTPMFIATHPRFPEFNIAKEINREVRDRVVAKVKQDAGLIEESRIRMRFLEARARCRYRAQAQLENRKDARWEALWKILA